MYENADTSLPPFLLSTHDSKLFLLVVVSYPNSSQKLPQFDLYEYRFDLLPILTRFWN